MKKNYLLSMLAIACFACSSIAQAQKLPCYSDELYRKRAAEHPELLKIREQYEEQIKEALKKIDYSKAAKTTFTDQSGNQSFWYDIPVVVHVIHDFGPEYLTDDAIFNDLLDWNLVYAKENADTADVVVPYKGFIPNSTVWYIGNPHIRLHFATRDPNGNPTKGITRHRNYLTYTATDQAKFDQWPPSSYTNLWVVNNIVVDNGEAAAYAQFPDEESTLPYYDGVISDYGYVANGYTGPTAVSKTINHELGHYFNLLHTWNNNGAGGGQVATDCGDDGVDDTPPTKGHNVPGCQLTLPSSNQNSTYDSACATNYFKIYTNAAGGDSLVNYPDTSNANNIMDYTYCARMFTAGQVARMHATLNNNIGSRNNLWDSTNLVFTGALAPRPDLKPIPDFSVSKAGSTYMDKFNNFVFPGVNVTFKNESWNDTVTAVAWTFSNGSLLPTSASLTSVVTTFSDPGWVTLSMKVTGNNTGDTTVTWPNAVFVADATATPATSFFEEFTPTGDVAKWPAFNYYNNEFKWQIANTGKYDGYSMEYLGYDSRVNPGVAYPTTGSPQGDFDEFFSVPVDLTGYTAGNCSLNFDYSGASRSSNSNDITDELDIDYSTNKSLTWTSLVKLTKGNLVNKGAIATPYTPSSPGDWANRSIDIPSAAITPYTVLRFRYKPNVAQDGTYSSGNNFYMDRIHFNTFPSAVGNVNMGNLDAIVVPNPTSGDAWLILKDADNTVAKIVVTDITGKVVYTASQQVIGSQANIIIPHSAISVKGMYIIQAATGANVYTQKLVVY